MLHPPLPSPTGTLFYDAACPMCVRWVRRWEPVARRGGFDVLPLQSEIAQFTLGLAPDAVPEEMKLRLSDGRVVGGVEAVIQVAGSVWWLVPVAWLLRAPGIHALARAVYRTIAANRCRSASGCATHGSAGGGTRRSRRCRAFLDLP